MAQKRMFDKAIIDLDRFMDLPLSSKALYFLLGMEADDEGFVSFKKVLRIHGGNDDDIKILISKKFLICFPSGVVVITHWGKNNYLNKNRIKETEYTDEKCMMIVKNGVYALNRGVKPMLNKGSTSIEENSIEEKRRDSDFKKIAPLKKTKVKKKTKKEFLDERRVESGRPPMAKRMPTDKQSDFINRAKLVDYFKEAVNQEHGTKYFTHPEDINDTKKENSKIGKMLKEFWKRCDYSLDKAKAVIDFYAGEYGDDFWNYRPDGCFRKQTIIDFENDNKTNNKKGWWVK